MTAFARVNYSGRCRNSADHAHYDRFIHRRIHRLLSSDRAARVLFMFHWRAYLGKRQDTTQPTLFNTCRDRESSNRNRFLWLWCEQHPPNNATTLTQPSSFQKNNSFLLYHVMIKLIIVYFVKNNLVCRVKAG